MKNSNPEEKICALMALVDDITWRALKREPTASIRAAVEASARALAAIPEQVVTVDSIRAAGGIVHSDGNIFFTNIDKLRAALRASSPAEPTINLKGHEFKPSDLLRRGVLNLRKGRSEFFWAVVSKSFGLGSTCSAALAAWAGRDPDTGIVTKEST